MVVDSSAIVAILQSEPETAALVRALQADRVRLIGAPTLTEATVVVHGRHGSEGVERLERLVAELDARVVPFDREHAEVASTAYALFGKGHHHAALNLGDSFTYAVAKQAGQPILCIGDDFARTDIEVVPLT